MMFRAALVGFAVAAAGCAALPSEQAPACPAADLPEGVVCAFYTIPAGDLKLIFEPFFTKKKMGGSGTGLGMAVVWGTVKDHKGYIDVHNAEVHGTTFRLYFPVTRREKAAIEDGRPLDRLRGSGESILVVDDIQQQREIAAAILTQLGYTVRTVASGEEAVADMQDQCADLLVLDIIMESGIDGLETYRRILCYHPGQKAIITSGYSETSRVSEAQRLASISSRIAGCCEAHFNFLSYLAARLR